MHRVLNYERRAILDEAYELSEQALAKHTLTHAVVSSTLQRILVSCYIEQIPHTAYNLLDGLRCNAMADTHPVITQPQACPHKACTFITDGFCSGSTQLQNPKNPVYYEDIPLLNY